MDVSRDPFAPYFADLGNLGPEGTSLPFSHFFFFLSYFLFVFNLCLLSTLQVLNDLP